MKKFLIIGLSLLALASTRLHATTYSFEDYETTLFDSDASAWNVTLNLEIGSFTSGFVPTSFNREEWISHWVAEPDGYYDATGPEWMASLTLGDNSTFAVGTQLYLWVFDTRTGASEQGLFIDPAWSMGVNNPHDVLRTFLAFSEQSTAILGDFSFDERTAFTVPVFATSAVPEPSTYGLLGACVLTMMGAVRRFVRRAS